MSGPTADQLFIRLPQYQVIICRKCQYAVQPTGIVEHLRRSNHHIPASHARYVQETVSTWDGWVPDPQQLVFPTHVERPIEGLAVYTDGLLCTVTQQCGYVCRSERSIREHWRNEHRWCIGGQRGRIRQRDIPSTHESIMLASQRVTCQQFFTWGPAKHYIHVRRPAGDQQPDEPPAPIDVTTRIAQQLDQLQLDGPSDATTTIQAGGVDEANPWLRRTQWAEYLQGIEPDQLLNSVATPAEDAEGIEAVARTIWVTIGEVAQTSQEITKASGNAIRSEAARTEKDRSAGKPLQAYMDMASIQKHVEPWRQILMFFVRTQAPHDWESPQYQFTRRQSRAWERLWCAAQQQTDARRGRSPGAMDEDQPEDVWTPLQAACMHFCVELLNQRASVHEYECALVCALAVLGRSPQGWRDADSYPPILSRMIKIARFMVVHTAVRLDPNAREIVLYLRGRAGRMDWWTDSPLDDEEYIFAGPDPDPDPPLSLDAGRSFPPLPTSDSGIIHFSQPQRRGPRPTFADWVTRQVDSFMVRSTRGPMQWMLDLRMYGLKIHFNSTTPGDITWMGPDELLYKDIAFTMGDFRGFIHGLVGATRRILHEQLLLAHESTEVPVIPWDRMRDDPTQAKAGWSFLDDSRTRWPVRGATWLTGRLGRADPAFTRFIHTSTAQLNMTAVDQYLSRVVEFREKLSVCIHVTGGQPARAPELLSLRHRNTEGAVRNVFIEDGMVVVTSKYHKGFYASNDAKIIHRYLPREVGELVVWYLWLVLPFVERLQRYQHQVRSHHNAASSDWGRTVRQWAYLWSPDPRTGREWTSERFRDVLKRETAIGLHGASLNIPAYRNIAIGISRRYLRESSVFPQNQHQDGTTDMPTDDADDEGSMDPERFAGHIADLQAGHSSHIAGMIYGREVTEQAGTTAHRREMFRLSSTDWHRFLGFPDVEDGLARIVGKRKCPFDEEAQAQNHQRRYHLSTVDMCDVMQKMTGMENITFRGNQAAVIQAIQRGSSPIVATMPTGGGKSMCFMLPAFAAGGLTVVVVPLIALRSDMLRRCRQIGISCVEWESRRPPDEASIVLVTPESALGTDFRQFLNRQTMFKRLDRIVIDECHIMLNRSTHYRPQLQQLGKLMSVGTQMVFLTATLPPSAEQRLWDLIKVRAADVNLYRSRTRRFNVAYRVWRPSIDAGYQGPDQWIQMPSVVSFIQDRIRRSQGGRVIIYGHTIPHVRAISQIIGCEAYFKDQIDRSGVLERFRQTPSAVVVATSALGMGVDIPDIRSIIHIGRPRTLLEYAQESGRAGRDGEASEAIMIIPAEMDGVPGYAMDQPEEDQARVEEYIAMEYPGCRRRVLDRYLDGVIDGSERTACGDSNEDLPMAELLCDGCQPDWQAQEAIFDARIREETEVANASSIANTSSACVASPSVSSSSPVITPASVRSPSPSFAPNRPVSVVRCAGYTERVFAVSMSSSREGTGVVPAAIEQRFHEQDIERRQPMQTYRDGGGRELQDEEILKQDASQWQQRCWSCWRNGRADDHELFDCRVASNRAAQQFKKAMDLGKIQFPAYAACWRCGMPQSVCSGWKGGDRGRGDCEYRHMLIPMVSSMLYGDGADESVREQWRRRVRQAGFDSDKPASVVRYFGQLAESNWVRHTELVATFIWLRRLYRPMEKSACCS